jgi:non-specific serine/threonine protein kinase
MNYDLMLTPSGHLYLREGSGGDEDASGVWMKRVAAAFSSCQAAGLFALAATKPDAPPPPAYCFWRDFACRYLTQLCRTPEFVGGGLDPIEPPVESELAAMLLSVPPTQGAEYLSIEVMGDLWADLDVWTRDQIAASKDGLTGWLKKHAAIWRQVGRVCFHLAENKLDSELPFAFIATYAPSLSKSGRVQYRPLGKALEEYAGKGNKKVLINLLSPVQRASEKIDFVKELVDSGDVFHPLAWTPDEAYRLLKNVPLLEESGLLVRLPDWWRKRSRPRVAVTIGENRQSRFGVDTMLDFKVGVALGEQNLTEEEWRRIMASHDGLVYVKGQWIEVDREKLSEALSHWKQVEAEAAGQGLSFVEGMHLLAGAPANLDGEGSFESTKREWSFVDAGKWLSDVLSGLHDPNELTGSEPNKDFRGTLRPYQQIGYNWLRFLSNLGLGACLADDMGLGKTVQVLSLLLALKQSKKRSNKTSLLVLPASLLANWKAEMKRFAPTLEAVYIHPSETDKTTLAAMAAKAGAVLAETDVVLTTYGMLSRQKWLLDVKWRLVILDEAQAIKNAATHQTRTVKQLKADARIALTGTPVENRLSDLWSLFDFLCPGLLGSAAKFKQFVKGLEAREQDRYAPLRNLVRPYVLRRLKTDKRIIGDLPDKTEMKAYCGLTKKQAAMYTQAVHDFTSALE